MGRKEHVPEAADTQTDHHTPAATVCTLFLCTSQFTSYSVSVLVRQMTLYVSNKAVGIPMYQTKKLRRRNTLDQGWGTYGSRAI